MNARGSFFRRWAIPMAATIPLCAIVFAFSLGPSPRKIVADFLRSDASAEVRTAQLDAAGDGVIRALSERVNEVDLPRRDEVIGYLGKSADPRALSALERLLASPLEQPEIRKQAFEATLAIDRRRGLTLAEGLADRPDVLGEAARRALETQERSALAR